jgi:uncharacterized protein involved in type VI secretion and phage assembly
MPPLYGKYRGKVQDNKDPLRLGRIRAFVPAVAPDGLNWAMPCVPYAGPQEGFLMLPPVGANVWVEFEGGDLNYPIWSGGFWGDTTQQQPPTDATDPKIKVLQTEKLVLIFDDQAGKLTAKLKPAPDQGTGQTMSLEMDDKAIVLTAKTVTITITPDSIELKQGRATVTVKDAIKLELPPASVEVSNAITLKNGATSAELATAEINLKNGAASIVMSPASVNVNNGALEIV